MKKLARTFLTIGKIFSIIEIASFSICIPVFLFLLIGGATRMNDVDPDVAAGGTAMFVLGLAWVIISAIFLTCSIISLALAIKAQRGLDAAKCKADARKYAIMSIVAGVLLGEFQIAAGIIMLVMKDSAYADVNVQNEPVDATVVE